MIVADTNLVVYLLINGQFTSAAQDALRADSEWVAVEVILEERQERELIPRLKRAGATGIITYPLNKVIP